MTSEHATPTPGPSDAFLLAETLATRLCHDLAGGLGALGGALEMAVEEAGSNEALSYAQAAAEALTLRLRLLRVAWGGGGERMSMAEIHRLAIGLPLGKRVVLHHPGVPAARMFDPQGARLLLNLLILAVESLHGAGEISLSEAAAAEDPGHETKGVAVVVQITGPRAAWPPGLVAMLLDPEAAATAAAAATPRDIQAPLTALFSHQSGQRVTLLLGRDATTAPPLIAALR